MTQPRKGEARGKRRREATETIHFEDSALAKQLSGPNDRWLALIEDAFDVLMAAPGGAEPARPHATPPSYTAAM